ncbi:hypothetical protein DPMN_124783 [Dreissena polymorpha]|uniref:Uncharacterized protein n=1 Tax=Dreissena polymorpha TaxID=45954 RepID=A0A9D4GX07_DREPO|nr:hypothetical protein DPMN_124783 [Dreissena polymorpha]
MFGNSVEERSKYSRESPNTKPPTHGKKNISVAANLFLVFSMRTPIETPRLNTVM